MFSAFPSVVAAFIDLCHGALADTSILNVIDGPTPDDEPGSFLAVGIEDPWDDRPGAGSSDRAWASYGASALQGTNVSETGSVTCYLYVLDSDGDLAAARAEAFRVMGLIWDALRVDLSMGLAGYGREIQNLDTSLTTTRPMQGATDFGAECALVFDLNFRAYLSGVTA